MYVSINNKFLGYSLIFFILSGYIYLCYGQTAERICLGIAILLCFIGINKIVFLKKKYNIIDFLYSLFLFVMLSCSIMYSKTKPLVYGVTMYIVYFYCINIIFYNAKAKLMKYVIRVSIVVAVPVIIASLFTNPISYVYYRGIFGNPNSMGAFAISLFTVILGGIVDCEYESQAEKIVYYVFLFMSLILFLSSTSRSACLICVLEVMLLAWNLIRNKKPKISAKRLLIVLLGVLALSVFIYVLFQSELVHNLINKTEILLKRGDITSQRSEYWKYIMEHTGMFGNGENVFIDTPSHNIYFGLMNSFGKLSAIVYFIFCIYSSWYIFKVFYRYKSKAKLFPILGVCCFMVYSMTENFLMTPPMLIFYFAIVISKKERSNEVI